MLQQDTKIRLYWERTSRVATNELNYRPERPSHFSPNDIVQDLLEHTAVIQTVNTFRVFMDSERPHYRTLYWSHCHQTHFTPTYLISLRLFLILSCHLLTGLPTGIFPWGRYFSFLPRISYVLYSIHLHLIALRVSDEEYKLWSS
jgi:hypothetical protein